MVSRPAITLLLVALLAPLVGCTETRSPRCSEVCDIEARCAEEREESDTFAFDKGECITTCAALERDEQGKELVGEHVDCVEEAGGDCAAIALCR